VVAEIDLGQAPKIIGCELVYRMKEPLIHAASRQPRECDAQPFLVVRSDCTHANRSSVTEHGCGAEAGKAAVPIDAHDAPLRSMSADTGAGAECQAGQDRNPVKWPSCHGLSPAE
jgi:hypothetical protein